MLATFNGSGAVVALNSVTPQQWQSSLAAGEFFLVYQPIMASGRVIAMEALLRWQPKGLGLISPLAFIPELEKTGAIIQVGAWVLLQACRDAASWVGRGHNVAVAVNISPVQLRQPDFLQCVDAVLQSTGLPARLLKLEITESMATHDEPDLLHTLRRLQEHGVTIALDDFGTGYANLRQILRLPIKEIKIDQCFVANVLSDKASQAVIESIINLAGRLELNVIAEGVELVEQHAYLVEAGCHSFQGYFFGKPTSQLIILGALSG